MYTSGERPITVKLFVDQATKKVVFMEASNDLLDILLSFLTLPLGTIVRLLDKHSSLGSMDQIYKSVEDLQSNHFSSALGKNRLLHPGESATEVLNKWNEVDTSHTTAKPVASIYVCKCCLSYESIKYSFDKSTQCEDCDSLMDIEMLSVVPSFFDEYWKSVLSEEMRRYMIQDDLVIGLLSTHDVFVLFEKLGIDDPTLVESDVSIGCKEILKLLQRSFVSKTPLTDVFVGSPKTRVITPKKVIRPKKVIALKQESSDDREKITVKVYRNTFDRKVLYVEAREGFVDQLFSYLTLPVFCVLRILNEKSDLGCADNLYRSLENLGSLNVFKNFQVLKQIFLDPVLPIIYGSKYQLLPVKLSSNLTCNRFGSDRCLNLVPHPNVYERKIIESNAVFMVSDELEVKSLSMASAFSLFRDAGVSPGEGEEVYFDVGEFEAVALLKACLTSKTPLTAVFGGSGERRVIEN